MGNPILTDAGRAYIAAKDAADEPVVLNEFRLGDPNVGGATPSDPDPAMVAQTSVVWTGAPTAEGIDPNNDESVIYSLLLGVGVGDFAVTQLGLWSDTGVLVYVANIPTYYKRAAGAGQSGNNFVFNANIVYMGIVSLTEMQASAETWQQDFTALLALKEDAANKGQPGGYAPLDGAGLLPQAQFPLTGRFDELTNVAGNGPVAFPFPRYLGPFTLIGAGTAVTGFATAVAMAALDGTHVAHIETTNKTFYLHAVDLGSGAFSLIGAGTSVPGLFGTKAALTALDGTHVVIWDQNAATIYLYSVDLGTGAFTLVGSGTNPTLDLTATTYVALAAIDGTHVVLVDQTNDKLYLFSVDLGTGAFTPIGTGTAVTAFANDVALAALDNTHVVLIDQTNDTLYLYAVDVGTGAFTLVGSGTAVTAFATGVALTAIDGNHVVLIEPTHDTLYLYAVDLATGAFSLVGAGSAVTAFAGAIALAAIDGTHIVFADSTADKLFLYDALVSFARPLPHSRYLTG